MNRLVLPLAGSICLGGCYSGLDHADDPMGADSSVGDDNGAESPEEEDDGAESACVDESPAVAPLARRLSHVEYRNSLQALFEGVELPPLDLPADATPFGFENIADALQPNPLLIETYERIAVDVSALAMTTMRDQLVPCASGCEAEFIDRFGARAFRRPLLDTEHARYLEMFESMDPSLSFDGRIQLLLQVMLQAPQFLYRIEQGDPDAPAPEGTLRLTDYEIASRLSYMMWQAPPDDALLEAAAEGRLADPAELEAQTRRLFDDPRARPALVDFHRQWLKLDLIHSKQKSPELFPEYGPSLQASIEQESARFVEHVMFEGDGTIEALLTDPSAQLDAAMGALYGVDVPEDGAWHASALDPTERAGILTRAAFVGAEAYPTTTSPPRRGKFVLEQLLCGTVPPPPADADVTPPSAETDPDATNREAFEEKTAPGQCSGCHIPMHGLGFAFEHYDALGRYQTMDNGKPVDASGQYAGATFDDALQLSTQLADSDDVRSCVATQWFRFVYARAETDADRCRLDALRLALADSGGSIPELLVAIATREDFIHIPR